MTIVLMFSGLASDTRISPCQLKFTTFNSSSAYPSCDFGRTHGWTDNTKTTRIPPTHDKSYNGHDKTKVQHKRAHHVYPSI